MTTVCRAYTPVATLTSLLALACVTQAPPLVAPPASPRLSSATLPQPEPEPTDASATLAEPGPKRTELKCEELDALPDKLDSYRAQRILSVFVRTASTPHDLDCVRRTVARFFPLLASERPPPGEPADLPDWWRTVGDAGHYADDDPNVFVVMPAAIPSLDQASRRRLAPLLCSENERDCGAEARIFLADAEERMAELADTARLERLVDEASERPVPSAEAALAACADDARTESREYAFSAWRSCVMASVPRLVRTPRGPFKLPTQGILTVRRSGYWDPCSEVTGFSLTSGLALTEVECSLSSEKSVSRWRLSRASPPGVRRVALFIALMDQMRSGPAFAEAVPIPADLPAEDPNHFTSAPRRMAHLSDASTLGYSVSGVLAQPLSGRVYEYHEVDPEKRLLVRLLRTSQDIGMTSCANPQDQPVLADLLAQMFPYASDLRVLEEQVTRSVSCVAPATGGD